MSNRQYGRGDVEYATWYSSWMKALALLHTADELRQLERGASADALRGARSHLRAIQKTGSMTGNSQARAHARNVTSAAGDFGIAIRGAIEIHELFPEFAKSAA